MKTKFSFFLILCFFSSLLHAQFDTHTQVYGVVEQDIARSHALLSLNNARDKIIGGAWNDEACLIRVENEGELVRTRQFGAETGDWSRITSIIRESDGKILAAGECHHCTGASDTLKKVFLLRVRPSLLGAAEVAFFDPAVLGISDFDQMYAPKLTYKGGQPQLAASVGGPFLNFEDIVLLGLNSNLDVQWQHQYNSCGNCGFDYLQDFIETSNGFAALVPNAFTDSITLWGFDAQGESTWKIRYPAADGGHTLASHGDILAVAGFTAELPRHGRVQLRQPDGTLTGHIDMGDAQQDEVVDVTFSEYGQMLALVHSIQPNPFGTYLQTRIYRFDAPYFEQEPQIEAVPNPDNITNMGGARILALSKNGEQYAVAGTRGFYNRMFFHTRIKEPQQAPDRSDETTSALPATITVASNPAPAGGHWRLLLPNNPAGRISLYDAHGKQCWSADITDQEMLIPVPSASGLYFANIETAPGMQQVIRLVSYEL